MRVLLVSHYFPPHLGGIENVVEHQARNLAAAGAEVVVLTTGERSELVPLDDRIRVQRIAAWNGFERRLGIPFPVPGPGLFVHAARWARWADAVHVHDTAYVTSWVGGAAAMLTRTPFVMTQHVALVDHPARLVGVVQRAVLACAGRVLLRRAAAVFVLNDTVAAFAQDNGAHPTRVHHLPNGVDTGAFTPCASPAERRSLRERLGLPVDRVLVLFAGRLVPKKGYDLLLAAAGPSYDLVFAGDGHQGVPESGPGTHHLGRLNAGELADAYRACDIFALPSTSEGFPLTVQEAMASGLPILTTDDPGYESYQLCRRHVRLVPREVAALRTALAELAGDPHLRERMGRWSRQYAIKRFSWAMHAEQLLGRYPL
ncbi:glycosyltransferase family 4 protein [Paractinoplanes durhamensis]|uniref:Glycoside hydrolase n=1 Tax=Paractinoplanes durhamensis TaxID=113563 RepID=A0ABQ3ZAR2_9ACTN|nr:glycosyltransferase family 4 protein [Actinoplanes durhamensis]GIE06629.1 glycoside hydrolase [Actinoplanes durhamensis]